jgi:hypothetical protein
LSGVTYVEVLLRDDALVEVLEAAEAKVRDLGLPCPRILTVHHVG